MIKVSVIVPIYNVEKYLDKCLMSLVNQTLDEIEIIAINDGSTDSSGEILDRYQKKYSKIRAYHQNNLGISATRNRGIELSQGEYLAFIDSDDSVSLDFCEVMAEAIEEQQSDVVACDFYEVNEETKKEMQISHFEPCTVFEKPNLLFDVNTSPWNKLYRKAFLLEHGIKFPVNLKYEDAVFWQGILAENAKIGKVDIPMVYYMVRSGSETTVVKNTVFDIFDVLEIIYKAYQEKSQSEYQKIASYLEYFMANRITVYNLQQVYQEDKGSVMRFIDCGFAYLKQHFPNWRKNVYFNQANGLGKRIIKKNKWITKTLVWSMRILR